MSFDFLRYMVGVGLKELQMGLLHFQDVEFQKGKELKEKFLEESYLGILLSMRHVMKGLHFSLENDFR